MVSPTDPTPVTGTSTIPEAPSAPAATTGSAPAGTGAGAAPAAAAAAALAPAAPAAAPAAPAAPVSPAPTIGRLVYFVMPDGSVRVATVVRVVPSVNLVLHLDGTNDGLASGAPSTRWVPSVQQDQTGKKPGTWHWMPFQMGQAAKTDDVATKLAVRVADLESALANAEKQIASIVAHQASAARALGAPPAEPETVMQVSDH